MKRLLVALGLAVSLVWVGAGQTPKYGAKATVEKNVDFAKFTTYSWTLGQPSVHRQTDQTIVAAIDRELSALGMKKVTSGPGDVLVSYASMTRTDVDLKGKPDASGARPESRVGTLIVSLLDRDNRQPLLRIRVDQPMETDPAKLEGEINKAVAAAFAEYPTRQRK
jgi:hypothetical protein